MQYHISKNLPDPAKVLPHSPEAPSIVLESAYVVTYSSSGLNGTEITIISTGDDDDYISLTDIARKRNPVEPKDVVKNWMINTSTIEFLGLWEAVNYPGLKHLGFLFHRQRLIDTDCVDRGRDLHRTFSCMSRTA
ncbi:MAG: KilA-N domain-containing protein [Eubacteriaceae bacterium]|nr:KilA-N domain-containing protein [Eubacteriaceae bacterium]